MAELYFLKNTTPSQMLGMVFHSQGHIVVIDGGAGGDTDQMINVLHMLCGDSMYVNGWFLTHPHHDHISVFCDIYKNHKDIRIDHVYSHFPPSSFLQQYDNRDDIVLLKEFEAFGSDNFVTVNTKDVFTFGDITVSVLQVFDPCVTNDATNNSSAVYMIKTAGKKVLIPGDLSVEGGHRLISAYTPEELSADYTQMTHHGQEGMDKETYFYIHPKACLWASPDWLWDNDPGTGFDTGIWQTVRTREWMQELGVKQHYVEKDGIIKIEL